MRRSSLSLLLCLVMMACAPPDRLEVEDVWTRDTVGRTANAAVFMTIRSESTDRLVSASTAIAKKTDLMTMVGGSGSMEMEYIKAVDIPADKPVSLNPSGQHVWLADLNQPLRAGQSFPLILEFEKAGERRVVVTVIKPAAEPPKSGMKM